MKNSSMRYKSY